MWQQRIRSVWIEEKKTEPNRQLTEADTPRNRSWRAFQLAFILINLPGLTSLAHPDRGAGPYAGADLLWFPTGGGKTEAYLGLAAYTMAIRRLQKDYGWSGWGKWRRGADALHPATADATAVPARCDPYLRV